MVIAALPVVASHFPVALTVLLKVTVRPAPPQNLMPFTEEPLTVNAAVEPNEIFPLVALISPNGLGGVPLFAAKVIGALMVRSPELWFSTFACAPPLSKSEITAPFALFSVQSFVPVHSREFMLMFASTIFVVCVAPLKVSVP